MQGTNGHVEDQGHPNGLTVHSGGLVPHGAGGNTAGHAVTVQSESSALISMIERAARDPNTDIDKMERLFQMHERMTERAAKSAYLADLSRMQPKLPVIEKKGKIVVKSELRSRYAKWEDIVEAIKPTLDEHGFSLSFRISQIDSRICVTGILGHRDGHSEETSISLPIDDSGSKNNVQGWGSSVSYGKRYVGSALLNLVARDEDDDGTAAGATTQGQGIVTAGQVTELDALITRTGADLAWILSRYEIPDLTYMTKAQFEEAKAGLSARERTKKRSIQ